MKSTGKTFMLRSIIGISVCVAAVFLSGCATAPIIKSTRVNPGPEHPTTKTVTLYRRGQTAPGNYEVVGVVSALPIVRGMMNIKGDLSANRKYMLQEASSMGADALVEFRAEWETKSDESWSTAIAVKTAPEGTAAPSRGIPFFVAVPHVLISSEVSSGSKQKKNDAIIQTLVQPRLAAKGYYAEVVDVELSDSFEAGLGAMEPRDLDRFGGGKFDLILVVRLVKSSGVAAALVTTRGVGLELALYSKSQKRVVWQSSAKGDYATTFIDPGGLVLGIAELFDPSYTRAHAVADALKSAFSSLSDVSTKTIE
jgi:hypothetical protein